VSTGEEIDDGREAQVFQPKKSKAGKSRGKNSPASARGRSTTSILSSQHQEMGDESECWNRPQEKGRKKGGTLGKGARGRQVAPRGPGRCMRTRQKNELVVSGGVTKRKSCVDLNRKRKGSKRRHKWPRKKRAGGKKCKNYQEGSI